MFSRTHKEEIDWPQLDVWIDEFGLRKFYDSYTRIGQYLLGAVSEIELLPSDRHMLAEAWNPLDLHETVNGIKGKIALVGNTWRARWKYREFTDMTWLKGLWIQVKGFLFIRDPKKI